MRSTFVKTFHGIPPWNKMWDPCPQGPWEAELLWMRKRNQSCWPQQRLQGRERKRDTKQSKTWFMAAGREHTRPLKSLGELLPSLNASSLETAWCVVTAPDSVKLGATNVQWSMQNFPMLAFQGCPLVQANSSQAGKGGIWIKFP